MYYLYNQLIKSMIMKKMLLLFTVLLTGMTNFAQTNEYLEMSRDVLKSERKEAIAEVMSLNETQETAFWELYNEYESLNYDIQNKRIALIKDYAENYESMTNDKADALVREYFKFKELDSKLKYKYYKKMKKVIPATEAAKFTQANSKIDTLIDMELALDIPLIETN